MSAHCTCLRAGQIAPPSPRLRLTYQVLVKADRLPEGRLLFASATARLDHNGRQLATLTNGERPLTLGLEGDQPAVLFQDDIEWDAIEIGPTLSTLTVSVQVSDHGGWSRSITQVRDDVQEPWTPH